MVDLVKCLNAFEIVEIRPVPYVRETSYTFFLKENVVKQDLTSKETMLVW